MQSQGLTLSLLTLEATWDGITVSGSVELVSLVTFSVEKTLVDARSLGVVSLGLPTSL